MTDDGFYALELDAPCPRRQPCGGSEVATERMLQFGRELHNMAEQLRQEFGPNEANEKALRVGTVFAIHILFSLSPSFVNL